MKISLLSMVLALTFTTTTFAAGSNSAELDLKIHNTITFKKNNKADTFEKIKEVSSLNSILTTKKEIIFDLKKSTNTSKLTYTLDRGFIRIQDENANIDKDVLVSIERSFFGRLKSFKIRGEDLEETYAGTVKNTSLLALKELDLNKNNSQSLLVGDQVCTSERSSNIVTCDQNISLKISSNKTLLTAALYIFKLAF
jgi:hypothetical protein